MSPSASVSLFNNPFAALTVKVVSSSTLLFSEITTGTSFTAVTMIPMVPWFEETNPSLSLIVYLILAVPLKFATGVKVTLPAVSTV